MKVFLDPYKILQSTINMQFVESEQDYVRSRKALLAYNISGKKEYEAIYVSDVPYVNWYNDQEDNLEVISPRRLLSEKYSLVLIPPELTDDYIVKLNLLNTPIEPTEKDIIKHFLGVILPTVISEENYFKVLFELSQTVILNKRVFKLKYLADVWRKRLSSIPFISQDNNVKFIFEPIIELDEKYCRILALGLYGSKNESFLQYWIDDKLLELRQRSIDNVTLQKIFLSDQNLLPVNEKLEQILERYFETAIRSGTISLSNLSGKYAAELNAIISTSKKIDEAVFDSLLEKFKQVISERQKANLKKLIIPKLVAFPELNELTLVQQASLLKSWAVENFIPFKFYYDEAESIDQQSMRIIDENAKKFGDWLFENISSILADDSIFTNIDVVKIISSYISDGYSVIWLIIDGLPSQYVADLELILKSNGINRMQKSWSFATLPTITEAAIPITVSGMFSDSINDEILYNRSELLKKAFPGRNTFYSSQPVNFQMSLNQPFDVCCLHAHDIDKEMHKNDSAFYSGRTEEIQRHFNRYVKIISENIRNNSEQKMMLVISTDHGATKCPLNSQMIKNPKLDELALSRPHERCIPLSAELLKENWEKEDFYILSKGDGRNKIDWALARGYKYFGKNDSGYRHGGLTPEEVVVPVITCQILDVKLIKLSVKPVTSNEFRFGKTEKNFKFRISNENENTVMITHVGILEEKETSFILPLTVLPYSDVDLTGLIKLHPRLKSHSKDGIIILNLSLKYTCLGEHYDDVLNISIFTEKDEFENDFI